MPHQHTSDNYFFVVDLGQTTTRARIKYKLAYKLSEKVPVSILFSIILLQKKTNGFSQSHFSLPPKSSATLNKRPFLIRSVDLIEQNNYSNPGKEGNS